MISTPGPLEMTFVSTPGQTDLALLSTPGPTELFIILVIVVILFGGTKLAGLGKSLGTAIREFKTSVSGEDENKPNGSNTSEKPE